MSEAVDKYIETHSKSQLLGFVLTFFLGPLGLLYSSWVASLILMVLAVISFGTVIGPVFCWILAMIIGFVAVGKHNEKVKATAALNARD